MRIHSEKPIYFPNFYDPYWGIWENVGGSTSKIVEKEFFISSVEGKEIQIFSVKDSGIEKVLKLQVPFGYSFSVLDVFDEKVFLKFTNEYMVTFFYVYSFDGSILTSFEVKDLAFVQFSRRAILFFEDDGIKVLKLKGEMKLHLVKTENINAKNLMFLAQNENIFLFYFPYSSPSFFILDLDSLELKRVDLKISDSVYDTSIAIDDGFIFVLDVPKRMFRKLSLSDDRILCEHQTENLRIYPPSDFYPYRESPFSCCYFGR
jgi:hypothetical protein